MVAPRLTIVEVGAASNEGLAGAERAPFETDPNLRRQVFLKRDILRYGPIAILRHEWVQLLTLLAMFTACAVVFWHYQGLDAVTAILASVSTITTIGIYSPVGGIQSVGPFEKIALIIIFLISVGAAASLVQGVVSRLVNKEVWTEEVLRHEVDRMSGHTIVMGYSHLGRYVAEKLDELRISYVVIVHQPEAVTALRAEGVPAFGAPATGFHRVLEQVGVRRAASLICTFDQDQDNLIAILYANKVRPELRIITTVHDRDLVESARLAGADVIVPTANILGGLLGIAAVSSEVAGVLLSARIPGRYLAEFEVPAGRRLTFSQVNAIAPILLVMENGQVLTNPPDHHEIPPGSTVLVLASPDSIRALRAHFGAPVSSTSHEAS
ncbi:MAG TPA: NAD(P)-binding protein [Thermoplasmata archaeon]|nr:NAD(P)-binding protein [Thermoplasmata archaeon]